MNTRRCENGWSEWLLAGVVAALLLVAAASHADTLSCTDDLTTPQIQCPALPDTTAHGPVKSSILDYDIWAWNSFIAMNWPALDPSENNNQRGFPDLSKSFATALSSDVAVWETYKEKREIFLADPFTGDPVSNPQVMGWNEPPVYGPVEDGSGNSLQIPCCPGADCSTPFERHAAKNTGDETAEVSSEARETDDVLCQGYNADCGVQGQPVGPRVWRGTPSDNQPLIYEVKVNWDFYNYVGQFTDPGPLWIQGNAETASSAGHITLPTRTSSASAPNLPGSGFNRFTNDPKPTPTPGPNPIVTNYSSAACLKQFQSVTSTTDMTPCPAGSVHLKAAWMPLSDSEYSSGDYHTSEVLYYTLDDGAKGDPPENPEGLCKMPGKYGLAGLHIIQRIHETFTGASESGSQGGTFIFATWEHVLNNTPNRFTYANLYPTTSNTPDPYPKTGGIPLLRAYDPLSSTTAANEALYEALGCPSAGGTSDSVWCNYMLVGTQYKAVSGPPQPPTTANCSPVFSTRNPPTSLPSSPLDGVCNEWPQGSGQPYFLANLVIESNVGLQQFLGVPPNQAPIDHYANPQAPPGNTGSKGTGNAQISGNSSSSYSLTADNLSYRIAPRTGPAWNSDSTTRTANQTVIHSTSINKQSHTPGDHNNNKPGVYNMGGCMGCHAVAQMNGYAFSFVLLDNQEGAGADTQEDVEIPPPPPPPTTKKK